MNKKDKLALIDNLTLRISGWQTVQKSIVADRKFADSTKEGQELMNEIRKIGIKVKALKTKIIKLK